MDNQAYADTLSHIFTGFLKKPYHSSENIRESEASVSARIFLPTRNVQNQDVISGRLSSDHRPGDGGNTFL
jgi:hypothetical protein